LFSIIFFEASHNIHITQYKTTYYTHACRWTVESERRTVTLQGKVRCATATFSSYPLFSLILFK